VLSLRRAPLGLSVEARLGHYWARRYGYKKVMVNLDRVLGTLFDQSERGCKYRSTIV
jgi:hypothetical protein